MPTPQKQSTSSDPCPCEACKTRRIEKRIFDNAMPSFVEEQQINDNQELNAMPFFDEVQQINNNQNLSGTEQENRSIQGSSFRWKTFLKETMRILMTFSFLSIYLAAMLICYAFKLACKIYCSKNRMKILVIILIGIAAIFAMHAFSAIKKPKCILKSEKTLFQRLCPVRFLSKKCTKCVSILENCEANSAGTTEKASNHRKFWFKRQHNDAAIACKDQENKPLEIMKKLKLHSIPMDMKRPPQLLVYARDYFWQ